MNMLLGFLWIVLGVVGIIPVANGNFTAGQFWLLFGFASVGGYFVWRCVMCCFYDDTLRHLAKSGREGKDPKFDEIKKALFWSRNKVFLSAIPLLFICAGIVDKGMSLFGELLANWSIFTIGVCQVGSGMWLLRHAMRMRHVRRHPG